LEPETINKLGTEVVNYETSSLDVLDLRKLREIGGFQLKKLLKSLTEDVKTAYYSSMNLPNARNSLQTKIDERLEKHADAERLSQSILNTSKEKSDQLSDLLTQRAALMNQLHLEEEKFKELEIEVDISKSAIGAATRENIRLKAECIRYGDADKVHKDLQNQVKDGLTRKQNLEKAFTAAEAQLKSIKDRSEAQKEKLRKEKEDLSSTLKDLQKKKKKQ
jgi:hypothetical protein